MTPRDVVPERLVDEAELAGLEGVRLWGDAYSQQIDAIVKAEAQKIRASIALKASSGAKPIANFLAISGGADDGAYGAGLLIGWSAARTRPEFELVTGVSAGALIAPFAYLGERRDVQLGEIFTKYGREDIVTANVLPGLLGGSAVGDSAPLERLIATYVDQRFLQDVARERMKGRVLLIGTTNLDAQRPMLWDMGRIAMSNHPNALALFRKVLLASASVPGAFPPVRIQVRAGGRIYEEMHVDGGVTQQVFLAPSGLVFGDVDQAVGTRIARQLYIIRNGKVTPEWQSVDEKTVAIAGRSISTLIKTQGIGDLYRIYSTAKRDSINFNLATIPADFVVKSEAPFDRNYMASLFECGYLQARQGYPWLKAPPGLGGTTSAAPSKCSPRSASSRHAFQPGQAAYVRSD